MATILVIDDERVIREGCRRVLTGEGHRVITAENGQEAMAILASDSPDVILCDLMMPVMSGMKVLDEVQASYSHIPVIILTGLGTVRNVVDCMKKGAYDFIAKPFRAEQLAIVVKHAVEGLPPPKRFESLDDLDL